MKAIHYACFKLEEKATRSIKKNKTNFNNVKIEDKFTMGIRWGKLTIAFCKKFFSSINIFNYVTLSWRSRFCK